MHLILGRCIFGRFLSGPCSIVRGESNRRPGNRKKMGLFRRIASIFGIFRDDGHDRDGGGGRRHHDHDGVNADAGPNVRSNGGFGVKVPVAVEKAYQGPVIAQCDHGEGGVQVAFLIPLPGFRWLVGVVLLHYCLLCCYRSVDLIMRRIFEVGLLLL